MFHRRRRCRVAAGGKQPHYYPPYSTALPSAASQPLHDRIRLLEADCCCCCCCFRVVITIIIIVALPLPLPLPCIYLLFYTYGRTDAQFHILHFNYKLQRRAEQSRRLKNGTTTTPFTLPPSRSSFPPPSHLRTLYSPPPPSLLPISSRCLFCCCCCCYYYQFLSLPPCAVLCCEDDGEFDWKMGEKRESERERGGDLLLMLLLPIAYCSLMIKNVLMGKQWRRRKRQKKDSPE